MRNSHSDVYWTRPSSVTLRENNTHCDLARGSGGGAHGDQFKESGRGLEELSVVGFKPLLIKEIITAAAVSVYEMIGVFFACSPGLQRASVCLAFLVSFFLLFCFFVIHHVRWSIPTNKLFYKTCINNTSNEQVSISTQVWWQWTKASRQLLPWSSHLSGPQRESSKSYQTPIKSLIQRQHKILSKRNQQRIIKYSSIIRTSIPYSLFWFGVEILIVWHFWRAEWLAGRAAGGGVGRQGRKNGSCSNTLVVVVIASCWVARRCEGREGHGGWVRDIVSCTWGRL